MKVYLNEYELAILSEAMDALRDKYDREHPALDPYTDPYQDELRNLDYKIVKKQRALLDAKECKLL